VQHGGTKRAILLKETQSAKRGGEDYAVRKAGQAGVGGRVGSQALASGDTNQHSPAPREL